MVGVDSTGHHFSPEPPLRLDLMNSDQTFTVVMTTVICSTIAFISLMSAVLGRARRRGKAAAAANLADPAVLERLSRMEQAIDSIAVEVERVSEGQRFVTKLLSDQRVRQPALPER